MIYRAAIKEDFEKNKKNYEIARKIYLSFPTSVFKHDKNEEFDIKDTISKFFHIPFRSIQVAGSAKTGESFIKNTKFKPMESDLDIAVIDLQLFFNYLESVFKITKGYRDFTKFSSPEDKNAYETYLTKGIFRPDLMVACKQKSDIRRFLNLISYKYAHKFKDINVSIYASECFFESKQGGTIRKLR